MARKCSNKNRNDEVCENSLRFDWPEFRGLATQAQSLSLHSDPFHPSQLPHSYQGFKGSSCPKTNTEKHSRLMTTMCGLAKFWSDGQFGGGLLNFPGPIFAWRRTALIFFFFSLKKSPQIQRRFQQFEDNKSVHPDLGPPNRIFAPTSFMKTANKNRAKSAKQTGKTYSPKTPPQTPNQIWPKYKQKPFLEKKQSRSNLTITKPKLRDFERFIFVLGDHAWNMVFQTKNKILIFLTTRRVARFPEKCHAAWPSSVVERWQK